MKIDKTDPAIIIIFGITGDLVKRKLFPAIYGLIKADLLNDKTKIVGLTRQDLSTDQIVSELVDDYPDYDEITINSFKDRFEVRTIDVNNLDDYTKLKDHLYSLEQAQAVCMTKLFYLSVPSQAQITIIKYLGQSGLNKKCLHDVAESRLLIEKPFGHDLNSAHKLIEEASEYFEEDQIYRIDHYVAKETVQNVLTFRSSNPLFKSVWSNQYIARIDITAHELLGVEGRGVFYEQTGALRDLIQNHLLQLMAITTMDEDDFSSSEAIHQAKLALLDSVTPITADQAPEHSFRGQYETYKAEVNNPNSSIETYAAIEVNIDNSRWHGVPIIISTGKAFNQKSTTIKVIFKPIKGQTHTNSLIFQIEPNEGISLDVMVKKPGLGNELSQTQMGFSYSSTFPTSPITNAYERVLADAISGDHSLFTTSQEIIASWEIVEGVLDSWSKDGEKLDIYKNDSTGPTELPDWLKPEYKL